MKSIVFILLVLFYSNIQSQIEYPVSPSQETTKIKAFNVLLTKCNVCHTTKKKQVVFTFENMDSLALRINKQVFIKEKMPKGRKNKLSLEESQVLQKWLKTILK